MSNENAQKAPLSLRDFIRTEAAKGTPPAETLRLVREIVTKDPSLIDSGNLLTDFPALIGLQFER